MKYFNQRYYKPGAQYVISISVVLLTSFACYLSTPLIGFNVVALILLLMVSVLAMLFDILPVLLSAVLSALIWNFFFIPPIFTLHINNAEDLLMFLLYFFIAFVNAVLTSKIRKEEKRQEIKKKKKIQYNYIIHFLIHFHMN